MADKRGLAVNGWTGCGHPAPREERTARTEVTRVHLDMETRWRTDTRRQEQKRPQKNVRTVL